jgi:hypothetical protein
LLGELDRYLAVTGDDMKRVAGRYFTPTNRTVLDVLPASSKKAGAASSAPKAKADKPKHHEEGSLE